MAKGVRIQKALGDAGILSRRKAEDLIRQGRITVGGRKIELGHAIDTRKDLVAIDGQAVTFPRHKELVYLMVNKPRGFVTTSQDELGRRTVTELVEEVGTRVYPIGRLDKDSEGLLLMTNDGQFANLIMHPSHQVTKTYRVTVRPDVTDEQAAHLAAGVDLGEGEHSGPATVLVLEKEPGRVVLQITISEGKNREIRRMCEGVGLELVRLKRVSVGPVKLGMLQPGKWRELKKSEVIALRNAARPASQQEPIPQDEPTQQRLGRFGKPQSQDSYGKSGGYKGSKPHSDSRKPYDKPDSFQKQDGYKGDKPYGKPEGYKGDKPYGKSEGYNGSKPHGDSRKPYDKPDSFQKQDGYKGDKPYGKPEGYKGNKPYGKSEGYKGDKPYGKPEGYKGDKPYGKPEGYKGDKPHSDSRKSYDKPDSFQKRDGYKGNKPYGKPEGYKGDKPYSKPDGYKGDKPYSKSEGYKGDKPYSKPEGYKGDKPYGKPEGYKGDKPYSKSDGYKGNKPYGKSEGYKGDKPYGKPDGYKGNKPYGKSEGYKGDKPYGKPEGYKGDKPYGKPEGYKSDKPYGKPEGYKGSKPYSKSEGYKGGKPRGTKPQGEDLVSYGKSTRPYKAPKKAYQGNSQKPKGKRP